MDQLPPFEPFIQVPGPNPILVSRDEGAWDENLIECCDVLKDEETYYLYYHGTPADPSKFPRRGYRLGVATAPHPLGPWTKHPDNPVLDLGPEGPWDDGSVACASILKEGADEFYLFYSGRHEDDKPGRWSIGLATGPSPVGPWEKLDCGETDRRGRLSYHHGDSPGGPWEESEHREADRRGRLSYHDGDSPVGSSTKFEGNPVMEGFGYVGAVFKHQGKYWLYTEHPIGSTGPDYGPISLAHAEQPEGPWVEYEGNPVLPAGEWGAWDDGGYSEAEVTLRDGIFHIFYGAARLHPTRILSQESIGYAYSYDGVNFTKFPGNPVAMREKAPGAAAFAEVHHLFEPPLIYLFHTLRYVPGLRENIEDLGVQVLATQSPFCIPMPVLSLAQLGPGESSSLDACPTVSLEHIRRCALTVECTFGSAEGKPSARGSLVTSANGIGGLEARPTVGLEAGSTPAERSRSAPAGLRLDVRSSADGLAYDTADLAAFDLPHDPGNLCRQTFDLDCGARFVKLVVENLDADQPVSDVRLTATLKG